MSGGYWDCYPEFADVDDVMQHIDALRLMSHYCMDNGKNLAAHELNGFIDVLVSSKKKISEKFDRVKDLIKSIDYAASGDCTLDAIDKSVAKFSKDAPCVEGVE